MSNKTKSLVAIAVIASTFNAIAEEKTPDPADLTETNTSAYVSMNNQGGFKGSISGDMSFDNGQTGMFTLEGAMDQHGNYTDSRLQYFHVFETSNALVPKAAASLDVIDNSLFSSASVGATLAINTGVKGFNIFPRAGVLAGKYSDNTLSQFNVQNDEALGVSAALYMFYTAGNDGTYFGLYPEYNYLSGDVDMSILTTNFLMSTPLNADRTRWGQIKIVNTNVSAKNSQLSMTNNDTAVWANYKFYF